MTPENMDEADPLIGKLIGHCTIQRKLGQGGMGAVYLAHHPGLNRSVAIKVLPGDLASNPEYRERFFREARLAARLEHPNVVQVHDVGEEQGVHYISMQYVEGKSLDAVLRDRKKLPVNEALGVTKRVAVALAAAAKLGIVHRDIKPHNILISKEGMVKVADFGLAKDEDANRSISEPGTVMGTPYYMSPEQAQGEKVDHRSDLYSLGATLYHLLSGRRLFEGGSPVSIMMKQASETPVPLREIDPSIPEPVAAFVAKALEKDPQRRFATAEDMVRAVDALKQPGATVVKPPPEAAPAPGPLPPRRRAAKVALPIAGILGVGIVLGLALGRGKSAPAPAAAAADPSGVKPAGPPKAAAKPEAKAPPKPDPKTPAKPADAEATQKPRDRILQKFKDPADRRMVEDLLGRVDELLTAVKRKDPKTVRTMIDETAFGLLTDQQVEELFARTRGDSTLDSWELEDLDLRTRLPNVRMWPHAAVTMTYEVKLVKGTMRITDQTTHWVRRNDGRWLLTRLLKPGK